MCETSEVCNYWPSFKTNIKLRCWREEPRHSIDKEELLPRILESGSEKEFLVFTMLLAPLGEMVWIKEPLATIAKAED